MQDVVFVDFDALFFAGGAPFVQNGFELFLGLLFLVAHGGGAFEILVLDRAFFLALDLFDLGLEVLDFRRTGHGADARARTGFIHEIDGLVRQETTGDIAIGKLDRGFEGFVGELGLVMVFVFRAQTLQDQDRFFDGRRFDFHGLETAFQRGVFLDVLAILVQRGRADALQFAAAESAGLMILEASIVPSAEPAPTMVCKLVNEEDDVLGAADFVHHRFDALFELAAVFGAGNHQREVESDDAFVAQESPAHCRWQFPGPDLRQWPSCRRRLRRAEPDCSSCGGKGSG